MRGKEAKERRIEKIVAIKNGIEESMKELQDRLMFSQVDLYEVQQGKTKLLAMEKELNKVKKKLRKALKD